MTKAILFDLSLRVNQASLAEGCRQSRFDLEDTLIISRRNLAHCDITLPHTVSRLVS